MLGFLRQLWRAVRRPGAPAHRPDPQTSGELDPTTRNAFVRPRAEIQGVTGWYSPNSQLAQQRSPGRPGDVTLTSATAKSRTWTGIEKVRRSLHIDYPRLRAISPRLHVGEDLTIANALALREPPTELFVGGNLTLRNCPQLERLPTRLVVGGSIRLEGCTRLGSLPEGLRVAGDLVITGGRSLTQLPAGLVVEKDLHLSGTRIASLPDDLKVGGTLVVQGRSRLTSIPDSIDIGGDIVLRSCPIESLPATLKLYKSLRVINARRLRSLPAGLHVPEKLDLESCRALESLPDQIFVGHSLKLRHCTALTKLPDNLSVPFTLDLRGCTSLKQLPRGLQVGHGQALAREKLGLTPGAAALRFGPALRLADCPQLSELPDDLQLDGPLEVAGSGLHDLPSHLSKATLLWRGIVIPAEWVFHPERLNPADILRQPNAELRRVALERAGFDKVLAEVGAQVRDQDRDPGGMRQLVYVPQLNHAYLVCRCPSTTRRYLLRVPPTIFNCHEAAAWMAGKRRSDYAPIVET